MTEEKVKKPPSREQLVAYIRKLEKRVRFLESQLKEHKEGGVSASAAISTTKPATAAGKPGDAKTPQFLPQKAKGVTASAADEEQPAEEMAAAEETKTEAGGPVSLGAGPAPPPPESREIDMGETPTTPAREGAPFPHPQNEPIVLPVPDILPPAFEPGDFTKQVLDGEDEEIVDPILRGIDQLKHCQPDEKRNIYLRITSVYWNAVASMGKRVGYEDLSWPKRLFMRFGVVDPDWLTEDLWKTVYNENSTVGDTGVYYLDEWLEAIYRKEIKYSSIDEMALDGGKPEKNPGGDKCVQYELINVPQMQRMVVGPRANLVAVLTSDFCTPSRDNPLLLREWVYKTYRMLIPFDYKMFQRKYKGEDIEVKPLWLILPGYGTRSACWEPWSPGNKRTGPRLMVCLFPPRYSLKTLIDALSDFRWTFAKEEAMHYWLSEGLTGKFLAMFSMKEQRRDMKQLFRDHYMHWMLNEPRRVPKLDKKIREFFYYNCPYADEVKETLKGGGLFRKMIELEMAKREREQKEKEELERIKAMREAKKAARKAKQEAAG